MLGYRTPIFGIVSILVIKDRTRGTGRFNLAAGALATMVGIGAALGVSVGGTLIQHVSYRFSRNRFGGVRPTLVRCAGNPALSRKG